MEVGGQLKALVAFIIMEASRVLFII